MKLHTIFHHQKGYNLTKGPTILTSVAFTRFASFHKICNLCLVTSLPTIQSLIPMWWRWFRCMQMWQAGYCMVLACICEITHSLTLVHHLCTHTQKPCNNHITYPCLTFPCSERNPPVQSSLLALEQYMGRWPIAIIHGVLSRFSLASVKSSSSQSNCSHTYFETSVKKTSVE